MTGLHNIRAYTVDDNPWCDTCLNGEKITGTRIFKEGGYICLCSCIPTEGKCDGYTERKQEG
jgi:hypothetical protein